MKQWCCWIDPVLLGSWPQCKDAGSSTYVLVVPLSVVTTSCRTQAALALAWWPLFVTFCILTISQRGLSASEMAVRFHSLPNPQDTRGKVTADTTTARQNGETRLETFPASKVPNIASNTRREWRVDSKSPWWGLPSSGHWVKWSKLPCCLCNSWQSRDAA